MMRWPCTLAFRKEAPTIGDSATGITETLIEVAQTHCAILPVGTQTFFGTEQLETPVTHLIYCRWLPFINLRMFNVILRSIVLPDLTTRTETYRVRRVGEWEGRHRYLRMDVELESYQP